MCSLSCAIAVAFVIATIVCIFSDKNMKYKLFRYLNPQEREIYEQIVIQRRNIYLQGLLLGIIISLLYIYFCKPQDNYQTLCVAIALTFSINYFYYILYPKKKYMLQYLDTKKENQAWLQIYRNMQLRFHLGFLFGLLACGFFYHFMIFFGKKK